jgi:hypothetical protein
MGSGNVEAPSSGFEETQRIARQVFGPSVECRRANASEGKYSGPIVMQDANFYLQRMNSKAFVAHSVHAIDRPLEITQTYSISYKSGASSVRDVAERRSDPRTR